MKGALTKIFRFSNVFDHPNSKQGFDENRGRKIDVAFFLILSNYMKNRIRICILSKDLDSYFNKNLKKPSSNSRVLLNGFGFLFLNKFDQSKSHRYLI